MLDKLPKEIREVVETAIAKIGKDRAIIALQGLIHINFPQRIIDGNLRQETIDGVNFVLKTNEIEAITHLYIEKIEARFPGSFAKAVEPEEDDPVEDEDLKPVVAPRRRKAGSK